MSLFNPGLVEQAFNNLPSELQDNRHIVEGSFVLCLWQMPELYSEYKCDASDFYTVDGAMMYALGRAMIEQGYTVFDLVGIETFLKDYPETKKEVDAVGGVAAILKEVQVINANNIEKYYDDLMKYNSLIKFYSVGYNIIPELEKFNRMTAEQVYDYIEYKVLNCHNDRITKNMEVSDLFIEDNLIDDIIQGQLIESVSISKFTPLLNNTLKGIVLGKLHLISGQSGAGKSTFTFANYVYPAILQGQQVCIITNELTRQEYIIKLLLVVLTDHLKYYKVTNDKILTGNLTEDDREWLQKAKEYINTELKGLIKFVDCSESDTKSMIKMIRKYSKVGFRIFLVDTFKSDDSSNDKSWANIIENSKLLGNCAKRNNVAIILTYQIAAHSYDKRWLHRGMLSESKQIINMCHSHIMIRQLKTDEFHKDRNDVKPYRRVKDIFTDQWTTEPVIIGDAERINKYILVFVDKNRSGIEGEVFLYQFQGQYAKYKEIALANPKQDQ